MMRRSHPRLLVAFAATILACASDGPTAPSGLTGTYQLRTVNGIAVPIAATACCDATLDSGSIQALGQDTIQRRTITHTAPANGLPGLTVVALGFYVLQRGGGGFALQPGFATSVNPPADTLYVVGDTLVVVEGRPRWQAGVRSIWRYSP